METIETKEQAQRYIDETFKVVRDKSKSIVATLLDTTKRPTPEEMLDIERQAAEVNDMYADIDSIAEDWNLNTPQLENIL